MGDAHAGDGGGWKVAEPAACKVVDTACNDALLLQVIDAHDALLLLYSAADAKALLDASVVRQTEFDSWVAFVAAAVKPWSNKNWITMLRRVRDDVNRDVWSANAGSVAPEAAAGRADTVNKGEAPQNVDDMPPLGHEDHWCRRSGMAKNFDKKTPNESPLCVGIPTWGLTGGASAASTDDAAGTGAGGFGLFYEDQRMRLDATVNVNSQLKVAGASELDFGQQIATIPSSLGLLNVKFRWMPAVSGSLSKGAYLSIDGTMGLNRTKFVREVTMAEGQDPVETGSVGAITAHLEAGVAFGGAFLVDGLSDPKKSTVVKVDLHLGARYTAVGLLSAPADASLGLIFDGKDDTGDNAPRALHFISPEAVLSMSYGDFAPYAGLSGTWGTRDVDGLTATPTLVIGVRGQVPLLTRQLPGALK